MNKSTASAHTLLLGSQSQARFRLLSEACIPFTIISQDADETKCDWGLPVQQVVTAIARYKMEHAIVPQGTEGQICFVLTADTLSSDSTGTIHAKPISREDAIEKIKLARKGINTCTTAFCLEKKEFKNNQWTTIQRIEKVVSAQYRFIIPDTWIERYFENSPVLISSGAIAIELYGNQFLIDVLGSYSAIVGLPMFELREALEEVGFF